MNGSMGGTSLQNLQEREMIERTDNTNSIQQMQNMAERQYASMQHLQTEQGHNTQHLVHQNQHSNYVTPQVVAMQSLAQDINNDFQEDTIPEEIVPEEKEDNSKLLHRIPNNLREPIVMILIFVLLSQHNVRSIIGKYIKQINPKIDGKVPLNGIIMYGIIYASLFHLSKKLWN